MQTTPLPANGIPDPLGLTAEWRDRFARSFFCYAFAIIFIWFGALKLFGVSPAYELVTRTFYFLSPKFVMLLLGGWELATGCLFLFPRPRGLALILMFLQIPGTFLPLVIVPELCFVKAPWILTTNGEFILKNLLMIGGGLLIGGSLKTNVKPVSPVRIRT